MALAQNPAKVLDGDQIAKAGDRRGRDAAVRRARLPPHESDCGEASGSAAQAAVALPPRQRHRHPRTRTGICRRRRGILPSTLPMISAWGERGTRAWLPGESPRCGSALTTSFQIMAVFRCSAFGLWCREPLRISAMNRSMAGSLISPGVMPAALA